MVNEEHSNDDDRVRDHLANERTFLAWLRTGVAAMGLGIVIAKLRYILGANYPASGGIVHAANIGIIFALVGISTIIFSVFFFLQIRSQIRTRTYVSKTKWVLGSAIIMVALGLIILWYLIQPTAGR